MRFLAIIVLCVLAAVLYGIVHDQITARVCIEYFTVAHPRIIESRDPTLLGLVWGVVATWWVGLILGVLLAIAARAGSRPKRSVASLLCPIGCLLVVMGMGAGLAGALGWSLGEDFLSVADPYMAKRVPGESHRAFVLDAAAHLASYALAFIGGLFLIVRVWWSRRSLVS